MSHDCSLHGGVVCSGGGGIRSSADRPTRDGEERHGGIAYLDHIAATSTNPVLLRAVAETRAELAATVAARPAGQAVFPVGPLQPDPDEIRASFPSSPVPDEAEKRITVWWRDCGCEWWTKSCEELHTRRSTLPLSVLRRALDGDQP